MYERDWEQFGEAYQKASAGMKRVMDGSAVSKFVDSLIQQSPEFKKIRADLVTLISDTTLGIVGTRAMEEILRTDESFKDYYSKELIEEIESLIKTLRSSSTEPEPTDQRGDSEAEPQNAPQQEKENPGITVVKPLRTLTDEAEGAHGYGRPLGYLGEEDEDGPTHHSSQDSVMPPKSSE